MSEISVFDYEGNGIRTVWLSDEPWWVLRDICDTLNLSNPSMVADRLDEDERAKLNLGRQGDAIIINESGLYNVIIRSEKTEAKRFKRWITHEVLPEIRKTGGYKLPSYEVGNNLTGATTYIKTLARYMEKQGHSTKEIAKMIVLVAKQYNLPIPSGFVKESPFEQMIYLVDVPKVVESL